MAKEICISTTPHETRLAILEDDQLAEVYYERENEYTLAGSVYKGRVTRVLPGMQSSFVDVGLERDAFLYVTDFLEDSEDADEYETSSTGGGGRRSSSEPATERSSERTGERQSGEKAPAEAGGSGDERRSRRGENRRGEKSRDERSVVEPQRAQAAEERAAATAALRTAQPTEVDRGENGDEGDTEAPQGTRRWRGRRGRRRGGMRAGVLGTAAVAGAENGETQADVQGDFQPATAPFDLPEHGAPGGLAAPLHVAMDVATDEDGEPKGLDLQAAAAPQPEPSQGRNRDRVGNKAGRKDRSARERGPQKEERPLPGIHEVSSPSTLPNILPGESLAKYGVAPSGETDAKPEAKFVLPARPINYTPPKPSTEVEIVLAGWDGGSVLPGESLSRYARASTPVTSIELGIDSGQDRIEESSFEASVTEQTQTEQVGEQGTETHTDSPLETAPETVLFGGTASDEATTSEAIDAAINAAIASATDAPPETVAEALPEEEHGEGVTTTAEPMEGSAQTAHAVTESEGSGPLPAELDAVAPPAAQEPDEYEPKDGEASARLSPPRTSELRFLQFFGLGGSNPAASEQKVEETQGKTEPAPERFPEAVIEAEASRSEGTSAQFEEPARSILEAGNEEPHETVSAASEAAGDGNEKAEVETYTSTSIHAETLRYKEFSTPDSSVFTAPEADKHTGVEHDLPTRDSDEEICDKPLDMAPNMESMDKGVHTAVLQESFADLVDQLQGFSPGSGLLEEEVMDEDEYDFDPVHAHADEHDLEDLEEETLDGDTAYQGDHDDEYEHADDLEKTESSAPRMKDAGVHEQEVERDEEYPGVFALEEAHEEDEEEAFPVTEGEPQRLDRGVEPTGEERARRGGRNGGRRRGSGGNSGGGGRRQSAQTQDLPIISDLLKQGQEILVQIAKEPIAKKGARITSHIALPGRFLVFMPTVHHVGVSRKISSDEERQRLKRILISEKGENSGGFIVRTAAEGASEEELRADLRFLISLWTEIKQRAETAKAPALIYHDLNLVERVLRDQVSSNFSTIWVDSEQEYERIVRFLNRFQPSLVRRVKLYTKETPLFEHFGIQEEISKALKSKVWLKSGGSIVINQTEALVAIDINTGKYVGKTARLEDTIVKTNLDAIPEIVRQIRLRDLGGIIVIDFIDMDERKNRNRVLQALEEAMKVDRAPSKVLQFNDFGLVAITRKRVKQSLERTLSVQCETCAGTGMVKSPITVCNEIFTELRKMQKHLDGKDVMLRVNPEVVKQLKSANGRWITEYEEMVGKTIIIKSDPSLHPEQFDIH